MRERLDTPLGAWWDSLPPATQERILLRYFIYSSRLYNSDVWALKHRFWKKRFRLKLEPYLARAYRAWRKEANDGNAGGAMSLRTL